MIDLLDFPIDPPDAQSVAYGGRDFGVYRSRYNGHHTGEDWRGPGRRSTLGTPVYSIGHGVVTYAAPLGWGADLGVVIVRHVFPDGSTILSFYGHLDPPSVLLNPGDCVARGDQVGKIGDPRSPPHLHFEIRSHTPTSPGPGYWSVDPTLAGWEPPSQYIWNYRNTVSPGVEWTRPFVARGTRGLGMLNHDTFIAIEDNQLIGINVQDGSLHWSQGMSSRLASATFDAGQPVIYTAGLSGRIEAYRLPDQQAGDAAASSEPSLVPIWQTKLDAVGRSILMPLPGGGVVASFRQRIIGVSSEGTVLWEQDATARVSYWTLADDRLIFSTTGEGGSVWLIDESAPRLLAAQTTGRPIVGGDQVWVQGEDGVYRLDAATLSAELLYALPRGYLGSGDMVALPDGGALLAHTDPLDKRLIALNIDGTVRWQRSFSGRVREQHQLMMIDSRAYLVSHSGMGSSGEVSVYSIDLNNAEFTRIFTGGSRNPVSDGTWAHVIDGNRILVNIGDSGMAALDTRLALEAVTQAARSQ